MKKRIWHYLLKPKEFEISCDKCQGHNLEWSEWREMIWCYDCKIDTVGNPGIFGGPIPVHLCASLGMTFHRWDMKKKRIQFFDEKTGIHKANAKREAELRK